jgi:NACalpha-BTF3-like transcription factor
MVRLTCWQLLLLPLFILILKQSDAVSDQFSELEEEVSISEDDIEIIKDQKGQDENFSHLWNVSTCT